MDDPPVPASDRADRVELAFLEALARRLPRDPRVLKPLGDLYTTTGRYQDGLAVDRRLATLCPRDPEVWYNLGCSLSLVGDLDQAFAALHTAIRHGYHDADWMRSDEDLRPLHHDPRFAALLLQAQQGTPDNEAFEG